MLSFRQKVLITYVAIFFMIIGLTFPFAQRMVNDIAVKAMQDRAIELIDKLETAPNNEALIRRLKEQKSLIFFRVSVITNERKVLYDSHTKRIFGPRFSQEYVVNHPEVIEAFEKGSGYNQDYSGLLGKEFAYFAKAFDFHGKRYVIRTAFPYDYMQQLTQDFEIGIIFVAFGVLLLFSVLTWFVVNHLTAPIHQMIQAVRPYQEGKTKEIPQIQLFPEKRSDEFGTLASTLNRLSARIREQIFSLTQERNDTKALLESLAEGIIAVDDSMHITFVNGTAGRFLKRKPEVLVGKYLPEIGWEVLGNLAQMTIQEKEVQTDTMIVKQWGKKLYLDLVSSPMLGASGVIIVLQDKSAHYRMMQMRKDFVANASHELKTPITIIHGFAETLHDNPDLPKETTEEITDKIVTNCIRMNTLVKDLLALADIEQLPESRMEECNLEQLVNTSIEVVHDAYSDAQIEVRIEEGKSLAIIGDPSLLQMALTNLVENAAKYSERPAKIEIGLDHIGDWIKIVIRDHGMGIPEEDLEHIFERFYTVDKAHSQKLGGSGLGLSIVEDIIEKHSGKITLESKLGEGTTFTVLLPVRR